MRSAIVTLVVGVLGAGAFLGGGLALQAAALPPAAQSARVAADAASWLLRYRLSWSSFHVDGRHVTGFCLHTWFPRRTGKLARGTILRLSDGLELLQNGGPIWKTAGGPVQPRHLPELELQLAGCPADLGQRVAAAAQAGGDLQMERTFVAGQPALGLRLPIRHERVGKHRYILNRIELYVSAQTYKPLAIKASLGRFSGAGEIRLATATPALLHRLTVRKTTERPAP